MREGSDVLTLQPMPIESRRVYEGVGGMETFRRLVSAFYAGVEMDPILRPMYPEELAPAEERLALFLAQFFGGPTEYAALRGDPRLRLRHAPFHVGPAARDAWLSNMLGAMEAVGIAEPYRGIMRRYFEQTANFLMNAHDG